ncbi:ABC transporter permease [Anaerolinea thermophila]|uniref:ABC transporter permease protein n=1 Tax=Anaerolinea thermophila (strain DSM 14523 / JCM 11388 / NBRC 100420 / UNI-1) TaxID=926569 RepID=E8N2D9_ANATU|nr:ABC transporter permease [Anaerolinea thermophila]BAJ62745.1 putative ABC transporter permease protein [Anaerolinea thermophila UNI-1]
MKKQFSLSRWIDEFGFVTRKYAPLMILISLVIFFSITTPNFMTAKNLVIIIRQVSFAAISAVGMMFVMIGGAIDLSLGSQIVLTNIVLSILMVDYKVPMALAIPLILVLGTLLGTINGFLAVKLKIHPLIITLGTASIYKGIGYILAHSRNIMGFPDAFRWFGQGFIGPIPVPIVVMIIVALIGSFILTRTYFGRYIFALGGNEEAARLAGVNVDAMKVILFAICGFITSITSVLLLSRVFAGQTSTGQGLEFDCLTAALLGGVSFKGGEGTIFGLITGILIIGVLNNAMQLASFPDFSQNVVKGAVLLIAVGFDVYQKNRKAKETVAKVAA